MSQTPAASGKQLIKVLEGQGWYVKRVRGSHHVLRHPSIPDAIPVPVHGNQSIRGAHSATSCTLLGSGARGSID